MSPFKKLNQVRFSNLTKKVEQKTKYLFRGTLYFPLQLIDARGQRKGSKLLEWSRQTGNSNNPWLKRRCECTACHFLERMLNRRAYQVTLLSATNRKLRMHSQKASLSLIPLQMCNNCQVLYAAWKGFLTCFQISSKIENLVIFINHLIPTGTSDWYYMQACIQVITRGKTMQCQPLESGIHTGLWCVIYLLINAASFTDREDQNCRGRTEACI